MRMARYSILVLSLVMMMTFAASCGDEDDTGTGAATEESGTATASTGAVAGAVDVEMVDISFMPEEVTIKVNGTVRWVNKDPVAHTVTDDQDLFDSGVLETDEEFERTYDEPGTYDYTCTIHPTSMTGTVIVEE